MSNKYLMVSLEEEKAKKLAEVLSNKTSRKILDYLSEKEATASDMGKALKIPLTTINYNIKNLRKNDLIEATEFKWSPKGREQDIYKVKKKYIIIAPGREERLFFKQALKKVLPIALIGLVLGVGIEFFTKATTTAKEGLMPIALGVAERKSAILAEESTKIIETAKEFSFLGLYFFIGFVLALILFLIFLNKIKNVKD